MEKEEEYDLQAELEKSSKTVTPEELEKVKTLL